MHAANTNTLHIAPHQPLDVPDQTCSQRLGSLVAVLQPLLDWPGSVLHNVAVVRQTEQEETQRNVSTQHNKQTGAPLLVNFDVIDVEKGARVCS